MNGFGMIGRGILALCLALVAVVCTQAAAEDAIELLRERDGTRTNNVNINYRQTRFERVLADLEKGRPGTNVKVKAESFQEEQDLLAAPVTIGPLNGVSWDTALQYVADRMGLIIDRSQVSDGLIYLEKVARFTDTFDGVRLGEAVREIAKRGNANIIFSPRVGTDAPVYLSFTDVPWRDALESLLKAHQCTVLYDANEKIMRISTMAEADIQFETRSRPLRYVQPEGSHFQPEIVKSNPDDFIARRGAGATDVGKSLIAVLTNIKSDSGTITYESRTNTLIIRDTPIKIQEMLRLVDEIDIAPQQVMIETRMVTLEQNPSSRIGVRWGTDDSEGNYAGVSGGMEQGPTWTTAWPWAPSGNWGNLGGPLRPAGPGDNGSFPPKAGAVTGNQGKFSLGVMSLTNLTFLLQMAQFDDKVQITQAPQILVLDNEEASVFIGGVRTYAFPKQTVSDGIVNGSIEERQILVGVQLLVVPHVCRGTDQVIVEIVPRQTDQPIIREISVGANKVEIPVNLSVKTVHTKMMLHSTETGVIAGLISNESNEAERKLPGLSKIPVFGRAFKHNTKTVHKLNSMILVTPTIIPPKHSEEFDRDVEELRESLASSLK